MRIRKEQIGALERVSKQAYANGLANEVVRIRSLATGSGSHREPPESAVAALLQQAEALGFESQSDVADFVRISTALGAPDFVIGKEWVKAIIKATEFRPDERIASVRRLLEELGQGSLVVQRAAVH